jgi:hypothetical protein
MAEGQQSPTMYVRSILGDNIVNSPDLARKIAALLLEYNYSSQQVFEQEPLIVKDFADRWEIWGTPRSNDGKKKPDTGVAKVVIRKKDGLILELTISKPLTSE